MKVFRSLEVTGDADRLDELIKRVLAETVDGWSRDEEAEARMAQLQGVEPFYCFSNDPGPETPASRLWLRHARERVYVPNVVPRDKRSLSHDEYNAIIEDFKVRCVDSVESGLNLQILLSDAEENIHRWLGAQSHQRLVAFSRSANKSTGSAHPNDQRLWFDFLVAAHDERSALDAQTLARWLTEEEGWPSDVASTLAVEYEQGRALLSHYGPHAG